MKEIWKTITNGVIIVLLLMLFYVLASGQTLNTKEVEKPVNTPSQPANTTVYIVFYANTTNNPPNVTVYNNETIHIDSPINFSPKLPPLPPPPVPPTSPPQSKNETKFVILKASGIYNMSNNPWNLNATAEALESIRYNDSAYVTSFGGSAYLRFDVENITLNVETIESVSFHVIAVSGFDPEDVTCFVSRNGNWSSHGVLTFPGINGSSDMNVTWEVNPYSGHKWTPTEVDNLVAQFSLTSNFLKINQIYFEIKVTI